MEYMECKFSDSQSDVDRVTVQIRSYQEACILSILAQVLATMERLRSM